MFTLVQCKRKISRLHASPLKIPLEFLTVNYICPSFAYGKQKISKDKIRIFKDLNRLIDEVKKKMTLYTDSLSTISILMAHKGFAQMSKDLMQSCEITRRRFDDLANIIAAFESKQLPVQIVPAHGNKNTLVKDCLEACLNKKRPGLRETNIRKFRKEVNAFLRIASSSRPLIIEKQPEINEHVDIYDIWNHKSIWKFP